MVTAAVGFHCPACARAGATRVHTAASLRAAERPLVTQVLVAVNLAVFVLTLGAGSGMNRAGGQLIIDFGLVGLALGADGLVGVDTGEWYRIVTGGFLHSGLIHVGFNMYLLWLLGAQLEPALGRLRFGLLYAASLFAGSFGVLLVSPTQLTVGASGAVFGLMGAMIVAQRSAGIDPWRSGIGGLVALNVVLTFAIPGISIGGHLGGLIGGALCGWLLVDVPARAGHAASGAATRLSTLAVAVLGVAFAAGAIWAAGTWADPVFGLLR
jgi:membrane associated rhomboid family serine protease